MIKSKINKPVDQDLGITKQRTFQSLEQTVGHVGVLGDQIFRNRFEQVFLGFEMIPDI